MKGDCARLEDVRDWNRGGGPAQIAASPTSSGLHDPGSAGGDWWNEERDYLFSNRL